MCGTLGALGRGALVQDMICPAKMPLRTMAGIGGNSFQAWTVLNAVLSHASRIEGRADCP